MVELVDASKFRRLTPNPAQKKTSQINQGAMLICQVQEKDGAQLENREKGKETEESD